MIAESVAGTIAEKVRGLVRRLRGQILHAEEVSVPKRTLGTRYGGHTISLAQTEAASIVYSFGIGEDASFDLELIAAYGCEVFAFDPTPRSRDWVAEHVRNPKFRFFEYGIGRDDESVVVGRPANAEHISHFALDALGSFTGQTATFELRSITAIMRDLRHSRIDILKLDIEGFEYQVIPAIVSLEPKPRQLLLEFHHGLFGFSKADTNDAVALLRGHGYRLFHVSPTGREYSFLLPD